MTSAVVTWDSAVAQLLTNDSCASKYKMMRNRRPHDNSDPPRGPRLM
jgi:hypothetical protein